MKIMIISILVLLFSGCSSIAGLWQKGASANDSALEAARAVVCEGASVGSVKRRYGSTAAQAKEYNDFCGNDGKVIK